MRKPLAPQLLPAIHQGIWAEKAGAGQGYRVYYVVYDAVIPWAKRTYRNRAMRVVWDGDGDRAQRGVAICVVVPSVEDISPAIDEIALAVKREFPLPPSFYMGDGSQTKASWSSKTRTAHRPAPKSEEGVGCG